MLKALALHGLAGDVVRRVHAHTEYDLKGSRKIYDSTWKVSTLYDTGRASEWRDTGFLAQHQKTLSDDYRRNGDQDYV